MNKIIYGVIIVALLALIGFLMFRSPNNKGAASNESSGQNNTAQPASLVSGDIAMPGAVATLYYGNGCPHCANIEKWLQDNKFLPAGSKIDQSTIDGWISGAKIKFNIKEIWYNKDNSAELSAKATALGLSSDQVGVPFLYDSVNNKSYIGETDIENFFNSNNKTP